MSKKDKCGKCSGGVGKKDQGVACESCETWFHAACLNIDAALYGNLKNMVNLHWFCDGCNDNAMKMIADLSQLQKRQDELEQEHKNLQSGLSAIINDVKILRGEITEINNFIKDKQEDKADIEKQVKELTTACINDGSWVDKVKNKVDIEKQVQELTAAYINDGTWVGSVKKEMEEEMSAVKGDMEENFEIERRKYNLVIHGIPEGSDEDSDWDKLNDILGDGLNMDPKRHVEMIMRLGRGTEGKARPLRIKLVTLEGRKEILARAKNLKNIDRFKKLFITPDLTKKQQEVDKVLRMKLKEIRDNGEKEAKINNGRIVKNGEGGQVLVLFQIKK